MSRPTFYTTAGWMAFLLLACGAESRCNRPGPATVSCDPVSMELVAGECAVLQNPCEEDWAPQGRFSVCDANNSVRTETTRSRGTLVDVRICVDASAEAGDFHYRYIYRKTDEWGEGEISLRVVGESLAVVASATPSTLLPGESSELAAEVLHAPAGVDVTYSWTPADTLSDPNISHPTAVPDQTTTYAVHVTAGPQTADADVTVTVDEPSPCEVTVQAWGDEERFDAVDAGTSQLPRSTTAVLGATAGCGAEAADPELRWIRSSRYPEGPPPAEIGTGQDLHWVVELADVTLQVVDAANPRAGILEEITVGFAAPASSIFTVILPVIGSPLAAGTPFELVVGDVNTTPVYSGPYADQIGSIEFELWRQLEPGHFTFVDGGLMRVDTWTFDDAASAALKPGSYDVRARCLDKSETLTLSNSLSRAFSVE